jgi:hypothetical protein
MAAESAKRFLVNATLYALKRITLMNSGRTDPKPS